MSKASTESVGEPSELIVYKTIGDVVLHLHVFHPAAERTGASSAARPVMLLFFGGGWRRGEPESWYVHCQHLAAQGYVAIAAEYRVQSLHGTDPRACVEDGRSAIRWLREHAAELAIDPQRLYVGGASAGGHVAACCAISNNPDDVHARPNAVVLFNPIVDNSPGSWGHERLAAFWRDLSPLHTVAQSCIDFPPCLIVVGTADKIVPLESVLAFQQAVEQRGGHCDLQLFSGQGHSFYKHGRG